MASSETPPPIPADELTDSAEVLRCLESARESWRAGQQRDAVRWLQRGAEAAEQDGNDMRALGFARAAADLSAQVGASGPPPLPAGDAAGASAASTDNRASSLPKGNGAAGNVTPPPKAVKEVSAPGAPRPPSARASSGKSASAAPSAPSASRSRAPMPPRAPGSSAAAPTPSGASVAAAASSVAAAASSAAAVSNAAGPASVREPAPPNETGKTSEAAPLSASLSALLEGGLAQRVTVKRSALDEGLLVVRPAQGTGGKAAHGTRQAVLIYVESSD